VDLGPVPVPVGIVEFAFLGDVNSARGMFADFPDDGELFHDEIRLGFTIGLGDCPPNAGSPCGSPDGFICGIVSRLSFGDLVANPLSQYRVDCQGRTGRFVYVQLTPRSTESVDTIPTTLSVTFLKVYPPSRIAPAIYPARAQFNLSSILDTGLASISPSNVNNTWQQKQLTNAPAAVGIVKIEAKSMSNLLRQRYLLADLAQWALGDTYEVLATDTVETVGEPYYGIDTSAYVGVSDISCDDNLGCSGHVCGIINQPITPPSDLSKPAEFHVDCRGLFVFSEKK